MTDRDIDRADQRRLQMQGELSITDCGKDDCTPVEHWQRLALHYKSRLAPKGELMDLDGYEKGYTHGWRDGRAETPDPGGLREAATEHHGPRCAFCGGDWKDDHFDEWAAKGHIRCRCNDNRCRIGAALASPVPTDRPEPCWFCEREVGYLIAGYDTWDEQRLACLDCDRTIKALYAKGWLPTDRPEPIDEERLWRAIAGIGVIDNGTWVSFRREDATTIAAAYRTEPGEAK